MDDAFSATVARALQQTRQGDAAGATRTIQAGLAPTAGRRTWTGAPAMPALFSPTRSDRASPPVDGIEDADVIEVEPRRAGSFAKDGPRTGAAMSAPARQKPAKLEAMLQKLRGVVPNASARKDGQRFGQVKVPDGARFETRSFASALGQRDFRLFVPAGLAGPAKGLVLMLHGCTQNPDDFAAGTDMNTHAQRHGLIVVYPHQTRMHNAQGCWNWFRPDDQRSDTGEAALLAALTRSVAGEFQIPDGQIFACGLSAGGAMVATLAATQPGLFAAVGVHSGLPHGAAHDLPSALGAMQGRGPLRDLRKRPKAGAPHRTRLIVFHGTADATVHPDNAEALVAGAEQHGLRSREAGQVPGGHPWTRDRVERAEGVAQIELWRVEGAGHAWSGGRPEGSYTDAKGPDASAEMIRFFREGALD